MFKKVKSSFIRPTPNLSSAGRFEERGAFPILGISRGASLILALNTQFCLTAAAQTQTERIINSNDSIVGLLLSKDILAIIFFLATAGILALLYFTAKRAKPRVVFPQFSLPDNQTPGVIHFLRRLKYEEVALSSTIVQMAVKGALVISKKDKKYQLKDTSEVSHLNDEELMIHNILFKDDESIELSFYTGPMFKANKAYERNMKKKFKINNFYTKNTKRTALGFVVILLFPILYMTIVKEDSLLAGFLGLPFLLMSICASFLNNRKELLRALLYTITAFSIPYILFTLDKEYGDFSDLFEIIPTSYFISTGIFYTASAYMLFIPTEKGAQALADIEGLLMYMKSAEQHRLNISNPPEQTPEHFEKLLPYAMVLDVSKEWCSRFAAILEAAQYQPTWGDETLDVGAWSSFDSSFAKPFQFSVASASSNQTNE
jgi:hypothetical protein